MIGTVDWFDNFKGFGLCHTCNPSETVFLNYRYIEGIGLKVIPVYEDYVTIIEFDNYTYYRDKKFANKVRVNVINSKSNLNRKDK